MILAKDAKWYAGWVRLANAQSAEEKLTNLETAEFIEHLAAELEAVKRERDAAIKDVRSLCATNYFSGNYCEYCKHNEPDGQCYHPCVPYSGEWGWEWRGLCKENGGIEA